MMIVQCFIGDNIGDNKNFILGGVSSSTLNHPNLVHQLRINDVCRATQRIIYSASVQGIEL